MEYTGLAQHEIGDQVFGIKDKNISNNVCQDRLKFYLLLDWAIHNNVDFNWLITGNGPIKKDHSKLRKEIDGTKRKLKTARETPAEDHEPPEELKKKPVQQPKSSRSSG